MIRSLVLAASAAAALLAGSVGAQTSPDRDWAAVTRTDVEAAWALLNDNHPGALPEIGDADFRRRLEDGRALALERAARVTDAGGHRAVLNGFAGGMGDRHIAFQPAGPASWTWAGVVFRKAGAEWRVSSHEPEPGEADLVDAVLADCDGMAADAVARSWLDGFQLDWSVEAQRERRGALLLLDNGNPFLTRPAACRFDTAAGVVERAMRWREITPQTLQPLLNAAYRGRRAGMGLRPFAGGDWIALQTLGDGASAVVEAVRTDTARLRASPMVVLDMRGNSGGSSMLGRQIAEALMGRAFVQARTAGDGACGAVWRASAGNLAALRGWRTMAAERGPEFSAWLEDSIAGVARANAAGQATDAPVVACPRARAPQRTGPASLMQGRLVLVTDESCFSSCLMVTDDFRRLGALHLGHATDRGARYMEVRAEPLPSGLGQFSTLQKMALGEMATGPFLPDIVHEGPMHDDTALEAWVMAAVTRSR
ncbi:MAG: hypothetical protein ACXW3O_02240 [Brevundimonas sp.]